MESPAFASRCVSPAGCRLMNGSAVLGTIVVGNLPSHFSTACSCTRSAFARRASARARIADAFGFAAQPDRFGLTLGARARDLRLDFRRA